MEPTITSLDAQRWSRFNDTFVIVRDGLCRSTNVLVGLSQEHVNFPITVRSSNVVSIEAINK